MNSEPQIQERPEQHYAGIRTLVTMASLAEAIDAGFPELFGWLQEHGIAADGPPFIRYLLIDMENGLEIELGVPVASVVTESGRIRPGVLPAGAWVVLRHIGPYDGLVASNAALIAWAQQQSIELDTWETDRGDAWRGRVEHYLTDPSAEPDPGKLETDVAFLAKPN
jgi:effector-binding domain-containing protein